MRLTEQERQLVELYRKLSDIDRHTLLQQAESWVQLTRKAQ